MSYIFLIEGYVEFQREENLDEVTLREKTLFLYNRIDFKCTRVCKNQALGLCRPIETAFSDIGTMEKNSILFDIFS